jgi:hypothetical protein
MLAVLGAAQYDECALPMTAVGLLLGSGLLVRNVFEVMQIDQGLGKLWPRGHFWPVELL